MTAVDPMSMAEFTGLESASAAQTALYTLPILVYTYDIKFRIHTLPSAAF